MPKRELTERERQGLENFKRMVRLLDLKRRAYFAKKCPKFTVRVSTVQFNHLMLLRAVLPCNLSRVMTVTGLTSAGASLFVEKLVSSGVLTREVDPRDRRNVIISATPETREIFRRVFDFILPVAGSLALLLGRLPGIGRFRADSVDFPIPKNGAQIQHRGRKRQIGKDIPTRSEIDGSAITGRSIGIFAESDGFIIKVTVLEGGDV